MAHKFLASAKCHRKSNQRGARLAGVLTAAVRCLVATWRAGGAPYTPAGLPRGLRAPVRSAACRRRAAASGLLACRRPRCCTRGDHDGRAHRAPAPRAPVRCATGHACAGRRGRRLLRAGRTAARRALSGWAGWARAARARSVVHGTVDAATHHPSPRRRGVGGGRAWMRDPRRPSRRRRRHGGAAPALLLRPGRRRRGPAPACVGRRCRAAGGRQAATGSGRRPMVRR